MNNSSLSLQWLEGEFLSYLDKWKASVQAHAVPATQKPQMLISRETTEGLHITGQ